MVNITEKIKEYASKLADMGSVLLSSSGSRMRCEGPKGGTVIDYDLENKATGMNYFHSLHSCINQLDRLKNITWAFSKALANDQFPSKLARLRAQLLEPAPGAGSGGGSGFDVSKSGDARIALVGFPSVGKSTFLSKITKTKSEVAAYSFTTLTAIPGVLEYGGAEIQILDLPGIIEGASEGKGRGRQVISAAKTSDLILMILDATKKAEQRALIEAELEAVGIRLNREPP
ncbi:MAG: hypothetical protein Q9224_006120 [Gallowayella concinna]